MVPNVMTGIFGRSSTFVTSSLPRKGFLKYPSHRRTYEDNRILGGKHIGFVTCEYQADEIFHTSSFVYIPIRSKQ